MMRMNWKELERLADDKRVVGHALTTIARVSNALEDVDDGRNDMPGLHDALAGLDIAHTHLTTVMAYLDSLPAGPDENEEHRYP